MKKISFLISALLFLSTIIIAQPKAVFNETQFDFGNITQGEVVSHEFIVKNEGTEALTIDKVKASCGCTAAAPDVEKLNPGDSAKVKVNFDSHGRRGVQKKYVYVFTNDPESPQTRLSFTTNIIVEAESETKESKSPRLGLQTKEIDFGKVVEGEVKSTQITFTNTGNADLIIKDVKSSCDCTIVNLNSKRLSPRGVSFIDLQFNSSGRKGEMTRTVTLFTNDKNHPQESIMIYANVVKGDKS